MEYEIFDKNWNIGADKKTLTGPGKCKVTIIYIETTLVISPPKPETHKKIIPLMAKDQAGRLKAIYKEWDHLLYAESIVPCPA